MWPLSPAAPGCPQDIYVNGILDNYNQNNVVAPTAIDGGDLCHIGMSGGVDLERGRYWDGHISNLAVWSKEFNSSEVVALYNGGGVIDIGSKFSSSLEAWYRFNEYLGDVHLTSAEISEQTLRSNNQAKRFKTYRSRSPPRHS